MSIVVCPVTTVTNDVCRRRVSQRTARRSLISRFVQVTTLGQPLEVLKTQMAANRSQSMFQAIQTVWSRGGVLGFYQGLIPWVRSM